MCGRFTAMYTWAELYALYDGFLTGLEKDAATRNQGELPRRFNIAPTQPILVLCREGSQAVPRFMRWGLVPGWVKDPNDFPLIINARSETLAEKASFRTSVKNLRCLVPASGYYEWRKNQDGTKSPFYITRADGKLMLFAGLYATWMGPNGEEIESAAIVTVPAKGDMAEIHDRTPAILGDKTAAQWLDTANVNANAATHVIMNLQKTTLVYRPVSTRVNSPSQDDEGLIEPVYEQNPDEEFKDSLKDDGQLDLF